MRELTPRSGQPQGCLLVTSQRRQLLSVCWPFPSLLPHSPSLAWSCSRPRFLLLQLLDTSQPRDQLVLIGPSLCDEVRRKSKSALLRTDSDLCHWLWSVHVKSVGVRESRLEPNVGQIPAAELFMPLTCSCHLLLDFEVFRSPMFFLLLCGADKILSPAVGAFAVTLAKAGLVSGFRNLGWESDPLAVQLTQANNWASPLKGMPASFPSPDTKPLGVFSSKHLVSLSGGFSELLVLVGKLPKEDPRPTCWIFITLWGTSQIRTQSSNSPAGTQCKIIPWALGLRTYLLGDSRSSTATRFQTDQKSKWGF